MLQFMVYFILLEDDFDIEDIDRCQTSEDGSSFNEFRKLIFIA